MFVIFNMKEIISNSMNHTSRSSEDEKDPQFPLGNDGGTVSPDGYHGPRSCMAFFQGGGSGPEGQSAVSDGGRIGSAEWIVKAMLAAFIGLAVLISIVLLPISMAIYIIYTGAVSVWSTMKNLVTVVRR